MNGDLAVETHGEKALKATRFSSIDNYELNCV